MKLFLVYKLSINGQEPTHYASYSDKSLVGIYDTIEKATTKVDELYSSYCLFQELHPEYDFMEETVTIEEKILNK